MEQTILIVDDDMEIRRALHKILRRAGYHTEEAVNGAEALQRIQTRKYDLITMDMAMSDMDGVDTISVLRNETQIPIVAISAFLTESIRRDLEKRNVHYFLEKPFSLKDVLGIVQQALEKA